MYLIQNDKGSKKEDAEIFKVSTYGTRLHEEIFTPISQLTINLIVGEKIQKLRIKR